MESTRRITEYLDLDLAAERWTVQPVRRRPGRRP